MGAHLAEEVYIGTLKLKNRIVMPPMVTQYASPEGLVTERTKDYYAARARGGAALIFVEASRIDKSGHTFVNQLAISDDICISGMKELVDEIVRLSKEFGILTEYTAFLAREGTDLSREDDVLEEVAHNLRSRAMASRSGIEAVNQSFNSNAQLRQKVLNRQNAYWDRNMQRVQVSQVRQVNDRAFYQQGKRWVDSRVVERQANAPDRVVEIGSPEFLALARRLSEQNRQGSLSFKGEIMLEVDGRTVLCK